MRTSDRPPARRATLTNVAEVTIYLWVIKILSTTGVEVRREVAHVE